MTRRRTSVIQLHHDPDGACCFTGRCLEEVGKTVAWPQKYGEFYQPARDALRFAGEHGQVLILRRESTGPDEAHLQLLGEHRERTVVRFDHFALAQSPDDHGWRSWHWSWHAPNPTGRKGAAHPVVQRIGELAIVLSGGATFVGECRPDRDAKACQCRCNCARKRFGSNRFCFPCYGSILDHGEEGHLKRARQDAALAVAPTHCDECGGTLVQDGYGVVLCSVCKEPAQVVAK